MKYYQIVKELDRLWDIAYKTLEYHKDRRAWEVYRSALDSLKVGISGLKGDIQHELNKWIVRVETDLADEVLDHEGRLREETIDSLQDDIRLSLYKASGGYSYREHANPDMYEQWLRVLLRLEQLRSKRKSANE